MKTVFSTTTEMHDTGDKITYVNGLVHSIDGEPAVRCRFDSYMFWFEYGKLHRAKGPAAISSNGYEYWLYGEQLSYEKWYETIIGVT